uniref:Uncharacterized protein n=1 Tax=Rhizophora mucronata TaxID=61149 RepID=A0A2P2Q193_RHIMU
MNSLLKHSINFTFNHCQTLTLMKNGMILIQFEIILQNNL